MDDIFKNLIGFKVSILVDNPKPNKEEKESYVGKIKFVTEDFIYLETVGNERKELKQFYLNQK